MKMAENVDGKIKNQLPSMKRAEIMDGKFVSCWPCVHEESCEGA